MFCITSVFDKYRSKNNLIWFCEPSSDFYVEVVDLGNLYRSTMRFDLACKVKDITNLYYREGCSQNMIEFVDEKLIQGYRCLLSYNRVYIDEMYIDEINSLEEISNIIFIEIFRPVDEYLDESYLLLMLLKKCKGKDFNHMFSGDFSVCFYGCDDKDNCSCHVIFMKILVKDKKTFNLVMSKYSVLR